MPRPAITSEKRAQVRQRIRECASRIAKSKAAGSQTTVHWSTAITVREIAEEAGISVGTFYTYFDSLAALVQSTWREPVDQLKKDIERDIAKTDDPREQVRILLQHYVDLAMNNQRMFKGAMLYVRPDHVERTEQTPFEEDEYFQYLQAALVRGQEIGAFRKFDCREMTQLLLAAIHGALALPINLERFSFDRSSELAEAMITQLMILLSDNHQEQKSQLPESTSDE